MRNIRKHIFCMGLVPLLLATPASARPYAVDYNASKIMFSGTHAGNTFNGRFTHWQADIDFDPKDLENSHIRVEIDTDSARTDNAFYDGTLPTSDWFDTTKYPKAVFTAQHITKVAENQFETDGTLLIKEQSHPIHFSFRLVPKEKDEHAIKTDFSLVINRLDYNIGFESDPNAEWVGKDIAIDVAIRAVDAGVMASRSHLVHDIQYY